MSDALPHARYGLVIRISESASGVSKPLRCGLFKLRSARPAYHETSSYAVRVRPTLAAHPAVAANLQRRLGGKGLVFSETRTVALFTNVGQVPSTGRDVLLATECRGCGRHFVFRIYTKGTRAERKRSSYETKYSITRQDAGVLNARFY